MSLLKVRREGDGSAIVWLHGFTQTRESAHQFRSILAGTRQVWTMDLPGHGSAWAVRADLVGIADLVSEVLPEVPVDLGGYSFGARVALHVALAHPAHVGRLVLLGASRGIRDPEERSARRERDHRLAARIERIGTSAFLDEWLAQPMFASLPSDERERSARSADARGLADSLRRAGTGTQEWLGERLGELRSPTLALAGARDTKFLEEARAIARSTPLGTFDAIDGAGHAAHLERPEACAARVETFLAS
jgi:2-succinyl-6-hydroxy-2,4-cyclohexadiene-1-carboxylate synthase